MALIYRCDRCGVDSSNFEEIGVVNYPIVYNHGKIGDIVKRELCLSCLKQLAEFLKPIAKGQRS